MPVYYTNERIIQDTWQCKSCGKSNQGLQGEEQGMTCPRCGAKVAEYRAPEDSTVVPSVTDPQLLKLANAGPNRTCPSCGKQIRAGWAECSTCGRTTRQSTVLPPPISPPKPRPAALRPPALDFREEEAALRSMRRSPSRPWFAVTVVVTAAALIALLVWAFTPHETIATVTAVSWHYTEKLEHRTIEHDSGWDWPPAGSFNQSCEKRQDGTENCHPRDCHCHNKSTKCRCKPGKTHDCRCRDGKEQCTSLNNGARRCATPRTCDTCTDPEVCDTCQERVCDTCYEQCPVYRQWCEYDHYVWSTLREEPTQGNDLNPRWFGLESHGTDERLERKENYRVILKAGPESWTEQPRSLSAFQSFEMGKRFRVRYTNAGTHEVLGVVR